MTEERNSVRVVIFGNEYSIRGEADGDYIRELARYVDAKMQEIARGTGMILPLKVSILAAINLADEVFRLRAAKAAAPEPQPTQLPFPETLAPAASEASETGDPAQPAAPPPDEAPLENTIAAEAIEALAKHIASVLEEE